MLNNTIGKLSVLVNYILLSNCFS